MSFSLWTPNESKCILNIDFSFLSFFTGASKKIFSSLVFFNLCSSVVFVCQHGSGSMFNLQWALGKKKKKTHDVQSSPSSLNLICFFFFWQIQMPPNLLLSLTSCFTLVPSQWLRVWLRLLQGWLLLQVLCVTAFTTRWCYIVRS